MANPNVVAGMTGGADASASAPPPEQTSAAPASNELTPPSTAPSGPTGADAIALSPPPSGGQPQPAGGTPTNAQPTPGGGPAKPAGTVDPNSDPVSAKYTGIGRLYHSLLDVMTGGGTNMRVEYDPDTGKRRVITAAEDPSLKMKPGQQWATMLAGALTGLAAGSREHGPGAGLRALGAGAGAGVKMATDKKKEAEELGEKEAESVRNARVSKANLAVAHQSLIKLMHENNDSTEALRNRTAANLQELQNAQNTQGGVPINGPGPDGVFQNEKDLHDISMTPQGKAAIQAHGQGSLMIRPVSYEEMDGNGEPTGVLRTGYKVVMMPKAWGDQLNTEPIDMPAPNPKFDISKPAGPDNQQFVTHTAQPGTVLNRDHETAVTQMQAAEHAHALEIQNSQHLSAETSELGTRQQEEKANAIKAGKEGNKFDAEANLANTTAQQQKDLAAPTPPGFVPNPDAMKLSANDLRKDLESKGVKMPGSYNDLYAMAHYKLNPNTFSTAPRKGVAGLSQQQAKNFVLQYINPNFDDKKFPAAQKSFNDFATTKQGTGGGNLVNINTATGHLGSLIAAQQYLKNKDTRALNAIANAYGYQTGKDPVVVYNTIANGLAGEIGKTFGSTTIPELQKIGETLNTSNGKSQLIAGPLAYVHMMLRKASELDNSHFAVTDEHLPIGQVVSPNSRKVYKMLKIDPEVEMGLSPTTIGTPAAATAAVPPSAKSNSPFSIAAGGKTYSFKDQAGLDAFKKAAGIQ